MLQLKNISKDYVVGNNVVKALKNINIEFRKNEFVSILGPSGCGKTTLLNIIGGLDKSTEGVLLVNGQSTKEYKSADWDIYRNKKIGFVFQSYNLIPHQSVFRNVELSLTLAGMSKDQRRRRVKKALESVGLGDQLYKKPNQLSGGQMQRVAIARALVNNPEIILADEPTGALDSESGVQVMNLLREVAKDRLVIMVTHNEHLANEYSTRIVKLKDGEVVFDSNPYDSVKEEKSEEKTKGKKKKISMSLLTALSLSLNNLVSKKGRSFLTAFAGSIGIIGICMVLALSAGVNVYIESIEKDALSLYPLRIEEVNMDVNAVISLLDEKQVDRPDYPDTETIYTKKVLGNVLRNITKIISPNDLKSFKPYIDENFDDSWGYVKYGYGTTFNVYCNYVQEESYMKVSPFIDGMKEIFGNNDVGELIDQLESYAEIMSIWDEMIDNRDVLQQQYELVGEKSRWPDSYDEVVLVVDEKNQLNDFSLFALGLKSDKQIMDALKGDKGFDQATFTVEELLNLEYRITTNADYYYYDELFQRWSKHENLKKDIEFVEENGVPVKVVGVVRPKPGAVSASISGTIGYTSALTRHMMMKAANHSAVKAQQQSPDVNILTGEAIKNNEYKELLKSMGVADLDSPSVIKIYAYSFEGKEKIENFIQRYNSASAGKEPIKYTDTLSTIMGYVDTFTQTVTGVLIGFSSISLVVSSIMIAIIIYTSILERRKEIGVLRSLGARKKDVSDVFIAESAILGVASGIIGVIITLLLTIPTNIILFSMFSVPGLATIKWWHVVLMIGISLTLSIVAGFIPSKMAADLDPVEALRTE